MTKFCKDCKFFSLSEVYPKDLEYAKCSGSGTVSLVSGEREIKFCVSVRAGSGECGCEAKLFQPSRNPDFRDGYARSFDDRADTAPDGRAMR